MGKIVAVVNQKGGVGKTTTTVNLTSAVGAIGKRCLLVDLDPQGNATSGVGVDKRQEMCRCHKLPLFLQSQGTFKQG
jgi:chromosome partitioning protein